MNVELGFLAHSGFVFDHPSFRLVFDWYEDPAAVLAQRDGRPLVYFASHSHHDHWNDGLLVPVPGRVVHRVLERGCAERVSAAGMAGIENLHYVDEHTVLDLRLGEERLRIECFPSTDEGVAFVVHTALLTLYHAGDLNCWDWQDEEGPEMRRRYREILARIRGRLGPVCLDLAMVPLDARLGETALDGCLELVRELEPRLLVPMHLNGGNELPALLEKRLPAAAATRVLTLTRPGQTAQIEM
ncbi:MAG: MBL fold metallo-hydrolase [Bacillota bacterium]|nr:MBL fold metallo-hydrolase [Bacillota bacterium]